MNTELCSQGKYKIRALRASGHILIYPSIHNLVLCGFLLFNAYHLFINPELIANNPVSHDWVKLIYHVFSPIRHISTLYTSIQFSSVTQSCLTLCDPMDYSMPGLPVHHQLLELAQSHVHRVGDTIRPSNPLSSPSPAFSLSQHQDLFQWASSSHQVAKVLELQLQHQSFQWIFRTDFL